jgi:dTDP-4-amino-4,6-dideoxygalactose transaminase
MTLVEGAPPSLAPVPFVDLVAEYQRLKEPSVAAVAGVLSRGDYVLGRSVADFEQAFAGYVGVDHAVGVDSGFSALELLFRAHGFGPGDEIITQANTFVATASAIDTCGAKPVLVDVDPTTNNLDPSALEASITDATVAIVPVHLYGLPADMDEINAIAQAHGLVVIEDACQAHGAWYRNRRAGSLGNGAAFSFYPSKNLGAPPIVALPA